MPRRKSARSDPDPRWTSKLPPAPGELRIVQAFVNTADFEKKTDLAGPAALARWLEHWSLSPADAEIDDAGLQRAIEVREALRALIRGNGGPAVPDTLVARLDEASTPIQVRFGPGGRARLEADDDLDGALARLCGIAATAQIDGSWERLKVCSGTVCRNAFFDFSTNRSAKYCQVQCGNRISALAYRRRHLAEIRKHDAVRASLRRINRGLKKRRR